MAIASTKRLAGYETTFITRVDQTEDQLKTLKDRLFAIVKDYKGELVYQEDWGKRKFSYPIVKEVRGQYTHFVYTGTSDVVAELERNLRLNESTLRFMTIILAKEFDKDTYMKELGLGTPLKREERLEVTPPPSAMAPTAAAN
jgi:small subunit ribosomal protein S6